MKLTRPLGNPHNLAEMTLGQIFGPELRQVLHEKIPVAVDLYEYHFEHSDKQRRGWHWLLGEWLKLDPGVAKNQDMLKTRVLIACFGGARVTDQHGNETTIPIIRTTQVFDFDRGGYRRKQLSKGLYTDLVEFTYNIAAPTVLPEMRAEYKAELEERK